MLLESQLEDIREYRYKAVFSLPLECDVRSLVKGTRAAMLGFELERQVFQHCWFRTGSSLVLVIATDSKVAHVVTNHLLKEYELAFSGGDYRAMMIALKPHIDAMDSGDFFRSCAGSRTLGVAQ